MNSSADSPLADDELDLIAHGLEKRYHVLGVQSSKIALGDWNSLPQEILKHVPGWLTTLLSKYRLGHGVLEYSDRNSPFLRMFRFMTPAEYGFELDGGEGGGFESLPGSGFLPFAYESDGSMWLLKLENGPRGSIYLLDHTRWDGRAPTLKNGLVFASDRLALLLASMAVSHSSYDGDLGPIKSILWYSENGK